MTVRLAGSTWNPLGRQTQPRMRAHDIWCLHTMAGSFAGTDSMFHQGGYTGLESHFGVRADGYAEQWQDLAYTADANLNGNGEVISTETEDYGGVFGRWNLNDPAQIPAWTDAQVARLIDLGVQLCLPGSDARSAHRDCPKDWACYREGIPAALIPDTKPGRRGIGYHAQGVPGVGLVPGGVQWSNARGKQCPGARRIAQLKTLVIPGIQAALSGKASPTPVTPEELHVATTDDAKVLWTADIIPAPSGSPANNPTWAPASYLRWTFEATKRIEAQNKALTAAVGALAQSAGLDPAKVEALISGAVDKALADVSITLTNQGGQ